MIFEKRPICLDDEFADEIIFITIPKYEYNVDSLSHYYTIDGVANYSIFTTDDDLSYDVNYSISFSNNDAKSIEDYVKKVYFNQPYTIVIWKDGTKTIVKCSNGCKYDKYTGLVTCFLKKFMGDCGFSKFKKIANDLIKDDE